MVDFSIESTVGGFLLTIARDITSHPVTDFRFLIPVLSLIIFSGVLRHMSKVQKVDQMPEISRKGENLILPEDRFHLEVLNIMNEKYSRYVYMMQDDFDRLNEARLNFKRLRKRYWRYVSMSSSPFKRRREKGVTMAKSVLNDMIDLYVSTRKASPNVLLVEAEEQ